MESEKDARTGDQGAERYRFGNIVVDALAHTIYRDQQPVAVEPKAFAVLLVLLRHAGQMVPRDDLLDQVWGHRHVTPGVLTRAIAQLRSALDDRSEPHYIQTQHALGYRFIGEITPEAQLVETTDPSLLSKRAQVESELPSLVEATAHPGELANAAGNASEGGKAAMRALPLPYAGDERRNTERIWRHWQWWAVAALVVAALAWGRVARWMDVSRAPLEASIAVLPFTTLSDDSNDRYFAEGLAIEMHGALSSVHGLKVAAWLSPSAIDRRADVKSMGKKLGVATVLDASVRREGERVRIDARLSDTASGFMLWSQTYERDATAVFDTQSDIAKEVATALVGVLPDSGEGLKKRLAPTRNVAAFDAYLRGLQQLFQPQGKSEEALVYFKQALAQDSGFARAQAAICRVELWRFEGYRDTAAFDKARLACLRARNMDESSGEVGLAMGDLYRVKGDFKVATQHYKRVMQYPETQTDALVGLAKIDVARGHQDLAMERFRQALEYSPGNTQVYAEMGYQSYLLGNHRDAVAAYRKVVELRPDVADYWSIYGGMLLTAGDKAAAVKALERSNLIEPSDAVLSNLGTINYQAANYAAAADFYHQAIDLNPQSFIYQGNLGDALIADPITSSQARPSFKKAAAMAQEFVNAKADDAKALAALGWYQANLGERAKAMDMVRRSEALKTELAEVALFNARTFALLGDEQQARIRVQAARKAGIAEDRITSDTTLKQAGFASNKQPAADPMSTATPTRP